MGIVAFYAIGKYDCTSGGQCSVNSDVIINDGRTSCLQAIKVCNADIDKNNLKFYDDIIQANHKMAKKQKKLENSRIAHKRR